MAKNLLVLAFTFLLIPVLAFQPIPPVYGVDNQNVQLFLHRLPGNITVSGFSTREVLNATTLWDGPNITPDIRYTVYNYTLYPTLASPLRSTGIATLDFWVTVSGAPGALNATLYELNALGESLVVSSSVNIANSTNPNTPYKVTMNMNIDRTFTTSSTLKLAVTATRVGHLYLWYDSPPNPSSLTLPTSNVPQISLIETFNASLTPTTIFSLNWTASQRIVFANIHVADPFGAYHVKNATFTILDPSSQPVSSGTASPFSASPGSPEKLFGLTLSYDEAFLTGNYTISAQAYDWSENQASASSQFTIFSYGPPPVIAPNFSSSPNGYGWNNSTVTVTWTVSDPMNGIASSSGCGATTLTSETPGTTLTCTATNTQGTSNSFSVTVMIDLTTPTATGSRSPGPNANGWNNVPVMVKFSCTDGLSGVDTVSSPVDVRTEGPNQSVTGRCADRAGNSATATVGSISVDLTAPVVTASRSPDTNADGWNQGAVTVTFACTDNLSGVDVAPVSPQVVSTGGSDQTRTGTCTDKAGNSASNTVSNINIDLSRPPFPWSLILSLLALAILGLILALLLLRRSREKCDKCGARLPRKAEVCPKCGQPTHRASKKETLASPTPTSSANTVDQGPQPLYGQKENLVPQDSDPWSKKK